ncbi:MAG: phosphoribosyltransferase [Bacteroidales bacterium]|nr:phosphoribosyltransferase [Bacteroidales bacterium]
MKKNIFVIMPFGSGNEYGGKQEESEFIFEEIIVPGVRDIFGEDQIIDREVGKSKSGLITKSIVEHLAKADIVIADITGHNPNVFLELGMRYSLKNKITIVLAQENTVIPFDIKGYRLILYNIFKPKIARKQISSFIRTSIDEKSGSDSIVFDTFKQMSVSIPDILESRGDELNVKDPIMSWDEYMTKIQYISNFLRRIVNEGKYVPDAVLGISNGGMIVADLIGKSVFAGTNTPILSLWAQRYTTEQDYFKNALNDALFSAIKKTKFKDKIFRILLFDDHLASSNTAKQAFDYIKSMLGDKTKIVFIPLVSKRIKYLKVFKDYLPFGYNENSIDIFQVAEDDFIKVIDTKAHYFPYLMKQVSEGLEHIDHTSDEN